MAPQFSPAKPASSSVSRATWIALALFAFAGISTWLFASGPSTLPRSHAFNAALLFVGLLLPAVGAAAVGVWRAKSSAGRVVAWGTAFFVSLPLLLGVLAVGAGVLFTMVLVAGG